ncbi:MAG: STAS domain-containing protein [Fibromonadaceae bacterium]|jgi:anti-anti-sigma regulatory factor|nr:STAS domain-containing protein [Fibromonadaceae bacterium]
MFLPRKVRGHYLCYDLGTEFTSAQALKYKSFLMDEIKDSRLDMAFDLSSTERIDGTAIMFFKNIYEQLNKENRKVAFFGGSQDVQDQLKAANTFQIYSTITDFERDFHEINIELNKTFFRLSEGKGHFRTLKMICPLCSFDNVSGFIVDESYYKPRWRDDEIVPVFEPDEPDPNAVDFSCYQVAVCPKCFYASTRLDWFTVVFPEGRFESHLTQENRAKLSNAVALRRSLAMSYTGTNEEAFFRMPREKAACYVAWLLNEFNLKHMSDQRTTDGFDVVVSNFMMCKFALKEISIDEHMYTALAWLYGIMDNKENYSTLRLAKAYVYLISVLLSQDKTGDARKFYRELEKNFKDIEACEYLILRAQHLLVS